MKTFDFFETLMLQMLEAGDIASNGCKYHDNGETWHGGRVETVNAPDVYMRKRPDMHPQDAYTFDAGDTGADDCASHRIFAATHELLLNPVWETFGNRSEVMIFDPLAEMPAVKWMGFKRTWKAPVGAYFARKPHVMYEVHFRTFAPGLKGHYARDLLGFAADSEPIESRWRGATPDYRHPSDTASSAVMSASMIEDAHRPGSVLVSVQDAVTLRFPTPYGAHKKLLALRDAPLTRSGRRKAILHAVRSHNRSEKSEVAAHERGVRTIAMDGINVSLEIN